MDLRDYPQPLVQSRDDEALRFVTDIVNPDVPDVEFGKWRLSELTFTSRGDLFQMTIKVALECQRGEHGREARSIEHKYLELAGRAVLDWPRSFIELVETTRALENQTPIQRFDETPLWRLQHDPTIAVQLRRQMKEAFNTCRHRAVTAALPSQSPGAPRTDTGADRSLRHPRAELLRLMRLRHSSDRQAGDDLNVQVMVLRNIPDVRTTSNLLGLPVVDVYELYHAGLIPHLEPVLSNAGLPRPSSRRDKGLFDRTLNVTDAKRDGIGVSLSSCRFALDVQLSGRWSRIFKSISDGKLQVFRRRPTGCGLVHDLYVTDLPELKKSLSCELYCSAPSNVSLTQSDLAMMMGKSKSTAARFVEATGATENLTLESLRISRQSWAVGFELRSLLELRGKPAAEVLRDLRRSNVKRIDAKGVFLWARDEAMAHCGL
ncbi:hypothetical protein [Rhizobium gallicum]|uniref:hypothetical protein n=1 Tax=Rhizobium gallicum TaxID=56730 RepID=UPI001EF78A13|nr:hypothetical protein [Rhizobium gallicum]ULJ73015.1 hypothetical protein L2W42_05055 [Rhizobium gallicum]